jgi:hypothetical protein
MTRLCCERCRLRLTRAAGAYLLACPECSEPLQHSILEDTVGFRLFTLEDVPHSLPEALVVSLPIPEPRHWL